MKVYIGDTIYHKNLGAAKIVNIDGDYCDIVFNNTGIKKTFQLSSDWISLYPSDKVISYNADPSDQVFKDETVALDSCLFFLKRYALPQKRSDIFVKRKIVYTNSYYDANKEEYAENSIDNSDLLNEEYGKLEFSVLNHPYFARIIKGLESFCIGKIGIGNIVDWRDTKAQIYYLYQSLIADKSLDLRLVRDLTVEYGKLFSYYDKYNSQEDIYSSGKSEIVTTDDRLAKIIKAGRKNKAVHDIIASIQEKQYQIMTHDKSKDLLVLGCAGSGKTMILFHRISYLLFNNINFRAEDIIILSPTKRLIAEGNTLSSVLGLKSIDSKTFSELYLSIFKHFEKNCDLLKVNISQISETNDYSVNDIQNAEKLYATVNSIINKNSNERAAFIISYNKFLSSKKDYYGLLNDYKAAYEYFKNYKKANEKWQYYNIEEYINYIRKNSSKLDDKDCKTAIKILYDLRNHKELFAPLKYRKPKKKKTKSGKNYYENKREKFTATGFLITFLTKKVNNHSVCDLYRKAETVINDFKGVQSIIDYFNDQEALEEKEKEFELLISANGAVKTKLFTDIVFLESSRIFGYNNYDILRIKSAYRYQLFACCLTACRFFPEALPDMSGKLVCIDEFQDLSEPELELIKSIFKNAVFNLYGDYNQCINTNGINDNGLYRLFSSLDREKININYRNAYEITNYINNQMGYKYNMEPVGVNGKVVETSYKDFLQLSYESNDRVVYIAKDYSHFNSVFMKTIGIVDDSTNESAYNTPVALPVSAVKGLEFEIVIVDPKDMTDNEKYVSFTRALNQLYIIK